jgi:NADP-dependent 3-hydroxy acid dehydrogenase YdfG
MAKTIVVCGYGPGISQAVARKFGSAGFQVALVSRSAESVTRGAAALGEAGITARGFRCDLTDLAAVSGMLAEVRAAFGPITVLHWNAYARLAGDLTTCEPNELRSSLELAVVSLNAAVQAVLPDLRAQPEAAVLVTGGGFALYEKQIDLLAVQSRAMGLAVAKAAQHKLVGVLHAKLKPEGVYVGEVTILGIVKGTGADRGNGTIEASLIAEKFWEISRTRSEVWVRVS